MRSLSARRRAFQDAGPPAGEKQKNTVGLADASPEIGQSETEVDSLPKMNANDGGKTPRGKWRGKNENLFSEFWSTPNATAGSQQVSFAFFFSAETSLLCVCVCVV